MIKPSIYFGETYHKRFFPKIHELRYQIFQIIIDLDDELSGLKYFSKNRFNLFSFYDKDHGPVQGDNIQILSKRIRIFLDNNNIENHDCKIYLMAMPRVLGFVFNPISIYFVEDSLGEIRTILYEVNNTFGDRHTYIIKTQKNMIMHEAKKQLHVSPFMDTKGMEYSFKLHLPDEKFQLSINLNKVENEKKTKYLFASFKANALKFDDNELIKLFFKLPFMTLKVVFGIHWEALKIIFKGIFLKPKPPTPKSSSSIN
ncbi:MAG: DUF1365 domain-containing protein [Proteobacteria bacterium]|nr:DUF1365 domain-containing protein [Pseudomonadota bacterium]